MNSTLLINSICSAIIAIDQSEKIYFCNEIAARIFNLNADTVIGSLIHRICPDLGDMLVKSLQKNAVYKNQIITGNNIKLYANINPIQAKNQIIGAICTFQESSEFDKIAEKLESYKKMNRMINSMFDSSHDGLFITNGNGDIIRCNKSSEKLIGHKQEDIIGKNIKDLVELGYIDKSVTLDVLDKKTSITMLQKIRGDRDIIVTGTPVFNEKKEIEYVLTNERDITELNKMKIQLRNLQGTDIGSYLLNAGDDNQVIAEDQKTQKLYQMAKIAAQYDSTVLIQGETGVGKSNIARFIHNQSKRKDNQFVHVNCGSIPQQLIESELFGYIKGAFTGADPAGKFGLFHAAHKGTIFLDEITEIPLEFQVKLLKIIESQEIRRVGDNNMFKVDVRIIAASNNNVQNMVLENSFREDLFYRLNVIPINMPPLRMRKNDIMPLIQLAIEKFNDKYKERKNISPEGLSLLYDYYYPGNIRELENIVERLMVFSVQDIIDENEVYQILYGHADIHQDRNTKEGTLKELLDEYEMSIIRDAINKYGSKVKAAHNLGVNYSTIVRKCQKYALNNRDLIVHSNYH